MNLWIFSQLYSFCPWFGSLSKKTSFLANCFRPPGKYTCWARLQELIKCAPSKNPDTCSYLSNLQTAFVEESKSYPNLGSSRIIYCMDVKPKHLQDFWLEAPRWASRLPAVKVTQLTSPPTWLWLSSIGFWERMCWDWEDAPLARGRKWLSKSHVLERRYQSIKYRFLYFK